MTNEVAQSLSKNHRRDCKCARCAVVWIAIREIERLERERYVANEWADMATNGVQWLRNIRDGISTPAEALAEMESNLQRIRAMPSAETTASAEAILLAVMFHDTYERLASKYGYETRSDTKHFNPQSPNGRLMIAVCADLLARERLWSGNAVETPEPVKERVSSWQQVPGGTWVVALADYERLERELARVSRQHDMIALLHYGPPPTDEPPVLPQMDPPPIAPGEPMEAAAQAMFEKTAAQMVGHNHTPWLELAEQTRDTYRREIAKRIVKSREGT